MNYLVTGGAGFIGSRLVRRLLAAGHGVRVLDDFSTGHEENLPQGIDLIRGSVATPVTAGKAIQGMDAVFHLAANPSVVKSIEAPLDTYRANATGTAVMLEASRREGVEGFVVASSCAVYGRREAACAEDMPTEALSPYAASKLAAEAMTVSYAASFGLHAVALRFFNVFGPGQRSDGAYAAVIPRFVQATRTDEAPIIYGDGKQTRDFVHVDDVIDALLLAIQPRPLAQRIINIGSAKTTSILDLVQMVAAVTGCQLSPTFAAAREGEVRHSLANISRAQALLGWKPRMTLVDGIRELTRTM